MIGNENVEAARSFGWKAAQCLGGAQAIEVLQEISRAGLCQLSSLFRSLLFWLLVTSGIAFVWPAEAVGFDPFLATPWTVVDADCRDDVCVGNVGPARGTATIAIVTLVGCIGSDHSVDGDAAGSLADHTNGSDGSRISCRCDLGWVCSRRDGIERVDQHGGRIGRLLGQPDLGGHDTFADSPCRWFYGSSPAPEPSNHLSAAAIRLALLVVLPTIVGYLTASRSDWLAENRSTRFSSIVASFALLWIIASVVAANRE